MQPIDQTSTAGGWPRVPLIAEDRLTRRIVPPKTALAMAATYTRGADKPEGEHYLWGAVPPSGDIFRHVRNAVLRLRVETSAQPEVANLQFTVRVDK